MEKKTIYNNGVSVDVLWYAEGELVLGREIYINANFPLEQILNAQEAKGETCLETGKFYTIHRNGHGQATEVALWVKDTFFAVLCSHPRYLSSLKASDANGLCGMSLF